MLLYGWEGGNLALKKDYSWTAYYNARWPSQAAYSVRVLPLAEAGNHISSVGLDLTVVTSCANLTGETYRAAWLIHC